MLQNSPSVDGMYHLKVLKKTTEIQADKQLMATQPDIVQKRAVVINVEISADRNVRNNKQEKIEHC